MKVFILAGQSNMGGAAPGEELPPLFREPPENVALYSAGRWAPLEARERFGPEMAFGHAMAEAWPDEEIGLVKFAAGGTSLMAWHPEWTRARAAVTENAEAGPLYQTLVSTVDSALAERPGRVVAVLWMQGERDSRYEQAARQYRGNMERFIQHLRRDLGESDLPFIWGQVSPPEEGYPYRDLVRAAQLMVHLEVAHTAVVPTDDLPKYADGLHLDAQGLSELGRRFALAYLTLVAREEDDEDGTGVGLSIGLDWEL